MIDYPALIILIHSAVDPALEPIAKYYKPANERDAYIQGLCMMSIPLCVRNTELIDGW